MTIPRDFGHLLHPGPGIVGLSNQSLRDHLALYAKAVERLNGIEAAYPLTDWRTPPVTGEPQTAYEQILDAPVATLALTIQDPLAGCIATVEAECRAKGIESPWIPYLGDDEFWAADQGRVVNIPWYLANGLLWRLANRQKETAATVDQVIRSLRHELGHIVNYAWKLWEAPLWQKAFGDFYAPYRDTFPVEEDSHDYVEYLTGVSRHYAQKHPDEAWAEAFARWLDPVGGWEAEYQPWPKALEKLRAVAALCSGVVGKPPVVTRPGQPVTYQTLRGTVRQALGAPPGNVQFSQSGWSEHSALLSSEPAAYNAVLLHELYFEQLWDGGSMPTPRLIAAVSSAFGSWESYILDLRAAAGSTSGWALTVWDERHGRARNVMMGGDDIGAMVGTRPLLVIDCHEHAYALDYGTRKDAYLAAVLASTSWLLVDARLPGFAVEVPA